MEQAPPLPATPAGHVRQVDYWLFGASRPRACPLRVLTDGADPALADMVRAALRAAGRPATVTACDPAADPPAGPYDYIACDVRDRPDGPAFLTMLAGLLAPGGGMRVVAGAGRPGQDAGALFDLLDAAGLAAAALLPPLRYDPDLLDPDPAPGADFRFVPDRARAALAESRAGDMDVHVAYARRAGDPVRRADPMDPAAVPVLRDGNGLDLARRMRPDHRLPVRFGTRAMALPVPPQARGLLPLIDGNRTLGDLAAILHGRGVDADQFQAVWRRMFAVLSGLDLLLLRAP